MKHISSVLLVVAFSILGSIGNKAQAAGCPPPPFIQSTNGIQEILNNNEDASNSTNNTELSTNNTDLTASCGGTTTTAPGTPGTMGVPSTDNNGAFTITWGASSGIQQAGYYKLYQSKNSGAYTIISTPSYTATSYAISGLSDASYKFRIKGCNLDTSSGAEKCSANRTSSSTNVRNKPSTPAKPSNINSINTSYTVSWSKPSGTVTYYDVQEKVGSGSWSTVSSSQSGTTLSRSGKSNNTTYYYRVRACNQYSWSCSAYSSQNTVRVELRPSAPAKPANVNSTSTSVTVSWSKPSGTVNFYQVQERVAGGTWATVASNNTTTSLTRTGRVDGTNYEYRLRACNSYSWSCSGYSSANSAKVRLKPSAPAAPSRPSTSTGSAAITWTKPAGLVTYYDLQKRNNNGSWSTAKAGDTGTSETVSGLTDGSWDFRVRACNGFSWSCSGYSAASSDTTVRVKPSKPAAPTGPTSDTNGAYTINWTKPSGTVTVYDVIEYKDSTTSYTVVANDTTALSLALSGRGDGDYTYRVRACNGYSWACSAYSSHSANLNVLFKPGTPASISNPSTDTDGTITIDWGTASGIVDEYRLEEQKNSGAWVQVQSGSTGLTKTRTVGNGTYHYRVKACNDTGCSGFRTTTAQSEIRLKPSAPAAPTGPSTSTGSAATNWSSVTNATYYDLQKRNNNGSWSSAQNGDTNTSHTESGLTDGSWDFRVRACNTRSWSCSSYSAASTDTTVRLKPSSPATPTTTVTQSTSGSYNINWLKPSGTVSFYDLQERKDGGSWSTIANDTTALTKAVSGRATGDYDYRARACNGFGWACSAYSAVTADVLVKRIPGKPTISSPTNETDGDGEYTLSWSATSEATYYQLQRKVGSEGWTTISSSQSGVSYSESVTDSDTYQYRVKACNGASWSCSGYSANKTVIVKIVPEYAAKEAVVVANAALVSPSIPENESVGTLVGEAGVSGGAASYIVPIALPPGRAGMQPNVSLSYSSRSGNGLAGVGWSLVASSSIHRCGKIAAIDGEGLGVTYDNSDDRLCLDGKRLILVSGNYGEHGATYRTELDEFLKVTQTEDLDFSSSRFVVYHKNGRISEYGLTTDSRQKASGRTEILTWALAKVSDNSVIANSITYNYDEFGDGEHLLTSIVYTGDNQTSGSRKVEFNYQLANRSDSSQSYLAGGLTQSTRLLDSIITSVSDISVREYSLDYKVSSSTERNLLTSLTECGFSSSGVKKCLPATTFEQHTPTLEWETVDSSDINNSQVDVGPMEETDKIIMKDLNGDGIAELLYLERHLVSQSVYSYDVQVRLLVNGKYDPNAIVTITDDYLAAQLYGGFEGDINGDGITDFLVNKNGKLAYLQFNNDYSLVEHTTNFTFSPGYDRIIHGQGVKMMDIDADGYQDIVFTKSSDATGVRVAYYRNKANGNVDFYPPHVMHNQPSNNTNNGNEAIYKDATLMDMDGDGLQDIVLSEANTTQWIAYSVKNNQGFLDVEVLSDTALGLSTGHFYNQYVWADLNGDGLKDFVRAEKNSGIFEWVVQANKGDRSFATAQSLGHGLSIHEWPIASNDSPNKKIQAKFGAIQVADIDGDGVEELLLPTSSDDDLCVRIFGFITGMGHDAVFESCGDDIQLPEHENTEDYAKRMYPIDLGIYDLRRFHWSILDFKAVEESGEQVIKWSRVVDNIAYAPIKNSALIDGLFYPGDEAEASTMKTFTTLQMVDYDNDGYQDLFYQTLGHYSYRGDISLGDYTIENGTRNATFTGDKPATGFYVQKNTASHDTRQQDIIYSSTDGLNNVTQWDYAPISRPANVNGKPLYTVPDNRETWYTSQDPNREHFYFTSSMPVVTNFYQSNGIDGNLTETTYRYSEAVYNRMGRGFQGFRTILVDSPSEIDSQGEVTNHIRSVTDFHQIFPLAGEVEETRTCLSSNGGEWCDSNLLSKTELKYAAVDTTDEGTYWPIVGKSIKTTSAMNVNADTSIVTSYVGLTEPTGDDTSLNLSSSAYDLYGNIKQTVQLVDSGFGEVKTETINDYITPDESIWWINQLDKTTVTTESLVGTGAVHLADLDPVKKVESKFNWTANRQLDVVTVTPISGGGKASSVDTDYNNYGLPIKVSTTADGITRVIETTYSDDGQVESDLGYFAFEVTNALGHSITTKIDPAHGQVTELDDANGLITKTEYDAFGRVEQVTPPTNTGQPAYSRYQECRAGCGEISFGMSGGTTSSSDDIEYKVTTLQAGSPTTVVYKDSRNRVLATKTEAFGSLVGRDQVYLVTEFDLLGRNTFSSIPSFVQSEQIGTHFNSFDALARPLSKVIDQADGASMTVTYDYQGALTNIVATPSTGAAITMSRTYSGTGQLIQTIQNESGTQIVTQYAYDSMGNPIVLMDAMGNAIEADYNALGQKKSVDDPNMGIKSFTYNGFGEVATELDANGNTTSFFYDELGRVEERTVAGPNENASSYFVFDTAAQGTTGGVCLGLPTQEYKNDGSEFSRSFEYDNECRPTAITTNVDNVPYTQTSQYDHNYGRVKAASGPAGILVETLYNERGYSTHSQNATTGYVYHQTEDLNARGQLIAALKADGVINEAALYAEETGQMLLVSADTVSGGNQRHLIEYIYDGFGNLDEQIVENIDAQDNVIRSTEEYIYDELHRLKNSIQTIDTYGVFNTETSNIGYTYDAIGNIKTKDDFGNNFEYGNATRSINNAGPNAVVSVDKNTGGTASYSYDNNGNMISGYGRTLTFNGFNKPATISKNGTTSTFSYGSSQMRYKQVKSNGIASQDETTIYIDKAYEEITQNGVTKKRSYIGDAIITETFGGSEDGFTIGFVHRDRLGSTVTITNELGDVVDNKSFDPFGKPREGTFARVDSDSVVTPATLELLRESGGYEEHTSRGFTDHEHLDDAELIHMNGRVYDYNLGRFLSVDPFIQALGNSQSMNPYSYILNNPLSGTDPSGYEARIEGCVSVGYVCKKDIKNEADKNKIGSEGGGKEESDNGGNKPDTNNNITPATPTEEIGARQNNNDSLTGGTGSATGGTGGSSNRGDSAGTGDSGSGSSAGGMILGFGLSLLPFGEAVQMAVQGNWRGALQSAAIEGGMMVLGAATGGIAYGAYKAYKASKAARNLQKVVTGGTNIVRHIGAGRKKGKSLFNPSGSERNCVNGVCAFLNTIKTKQLRTASPDVAENGGLINNALKQISQQTGAKYSKHFQFNDLQTANSRQFYAVFQGSSSKVSGHIAVGINNKGRKTIFDPQSGETFKDLSEFGDFVAFPLKLP
jgi:RHS repeat-associated protein